MAFDPFTVTFLGTSSGGGPTSTRNCSSLVCDMLQDGSLWMVDCAEGTARQFQLQPKDMAPYLRMNKVKKIFVTHMHADHVMGIVPLIRNLLFPPAAGNSASFNSKLGIEMYGPAGLRLFVRQILKMTLTRTSDSYVVHELLTEQDVATPCEKPPSSDTGFDVLRPNVMHSSEEVGLDLRASPEDGLWHRITSSQGRLSEIVVDAGPIYHRDPCLGYVFYESRYPSRKLVILGDTYDPSPIVPLCLDPPPALLIHEATDSHISNHADPSGRFSRRTPEDVEAKALLRGHSVPEMAGNFAKRIGAKQLVLNHIGGRFPAPRHARDYGIINVIRDIEKNASQAWGQEGNAIVASDYLQIRVPVNPIPVGDEADHERTGGAGASWSGGHHHHRHERRPDHSDGFQGAKRQRQ